jgi:dipeptidase E
MTRKRQPQIIFMGSREDMRYALKQCQSKKPRVCFFGGAYGDAPELREHHKKTFKGLPMKLSFCSLYHPPVRDLESFVLSQDIILVGGGNTLNLIAVWKEWGLDKIFYKAWKKGVILAGGSAGAICWAESGTTDSWPGFFGVIPGLKFLNFSHCPHYDSDNRYEGRRKNYLNAVKRGALKAGYATEENTVMHFIGTKLHKVLCTKPKARVYYVHKKGNQAVEETIVPEYIGPKRKEGDRTK